MTLLQQIKEARKECRQSVETCKDYPIIRCGGWQLIAEYNDNEINNSCGHGSITLKEINAFQEQDHPVGTSFYIRGQYDVHSHVDYNHELHDINYDATEFWDVDL